MSTGAERLDSLIEFLTAFLFGSAGGAVFNGIARLLEADRKATIDREERTEAREYEAAMSLAQAAAAVVNAMTAVGAQQEGSLDWSAYLAALLQAERDFDAARAAAMVLLRDEGLDSASSSLGLFIFQFRTGLVSWLDAVAVPGDARPPVTLAADDIAEAYHSLVSRIQVLVATQ